MINKALKEENPEKKQGFANAVAYYMKLAYSNWHKEKVHDDAIQSELTSITDGQLAFTNTPYVRSAEDKRRQTATKEETSTISATNGIRNFSRVDGTQE